MSIRELDELSGVRRMAIARLRDTPHRSRSARRRTVLALAETLNKVARERDPDGPLPFPDEDEVLRLAGLAETGHLRSDQPVSVREAILLSDEYDKQEKATLLGLIDLLDRQRTRDQRDSA